MTWDVFSVLAAFWTVACSHAWGKAVDLWIDSSRGMHNFRKEMWDVLRM